MTALIQVDEEELRTVRSRLLRLLDEDERKRAGSVYLEVVDGARWWAIAMPPRNLAGRWPTRLAAPTPP